MSEVLKNKIIIQKLIKMDNNLKIVFDYVHPETAFVNLPKPPYVALIGAVIGQIIRYTDAKRIRGNLYKQFGDKFTIEDIENATEEIWAKIGLDINKMDIIKRINDFINNTNNKMENALDIKRLRSVKGVGDWTIETTLLTSMLEWDVFPARDVFIRKKMQKLYNLKKRPTEKEALYMAEKWSPYRSVVTWYLWRWFD